MTQEQEKAAQTLWKSSTRALQIVAGAGSGKTTTMLEALQMAAQAGYHPDEMALITFTRKAGKEMEERQHKKGITSAFTGTMHALALKLIGGTASGFSVLANGEQIKKDMIRTLFPWYSHIPIDLLVNGNILNKKENETFQNEYKQHKKNNRLIEFDDMISIATKEKAGERKFRVLFVDEFQDTSPDQLAFIQSLQAQKLFVVGDDWQSIYAFRGANVSLSRNFPKIFPESKRLFLTRNFRSQQRIVTLGNRAIRLSSEFVPKNLKAHHAAAKPCRLFLAMRERSPAEHAQIFREICKQPGQILARTNYLVDRIAGSFPENTGTMHSSKGLEYDTVTLFGIAPSYMPHPHGYTDEEIRLFYVGITRARHEINFVAWEEKGKYSRLLPFLANHCRIQYF